MFLSPGMKGERGGPVGAGAKGLKGDQGAEGPQGLPGIFLHINFTQCIGFRFKSSRILNRKICYQ